MMMAEPKRTTVKDIIRWHRHCAKAEAAGFPATEKGVEAYRRSVFQRFALRRHKRETRPIIEYFYDPLALAQADLSQIGRPGACIGIDTRTATGARIAAERSSLLSDVLGNTLSAFGTAGRFF